LADLYKNESRILPGGIKVSIRLSPKTHLHNLRSKLPSDFDKH
jgi:hypothetical protein